MLFEPLISQLVHVHVVLILHHSGDDIEVLIAFVQIGPRSFPLYNQQLRLYTILNHQVPYHMTREECLCVFWIVWEGRSSTAGDESDRI